MSDTKVVNEGLPVEQLNRGSTPEEVRNAVGEAAKRLREEHGVHPLEAFREAHARASEHSGKDLGRVD